MIKDIVVNLSLNTSRTAAMRYAISVASTLQAHLAGIAFVYEPTFPSVYTGKSMPGSDIVFQREEAQRRANAAIATFEEAARKASLAVESHAPDTKAARVGDQFAKIARRFDLAIVGQAEPDKESVEDHIAEAALFESGRPVLFVPYVQKAGFNLRHVTICWDGSRAAARAIADAIPFLTRAKHVDIIVMESERPKSEDFPGIDMAHHLARHGLKVELKRIQLNMDVGNTILNYATDAATDMIVMGGYGHSRLREFILGGATRSLLETMTAPTLMSH
jgi:nucleotide-binding universal stress UspA family protein